MKSFEKVIQENLRPGNFLRDGYVYRTDGFELTPVIAKLFREFLKSLCGEKLKIASGVLIGIRYPGRVEDGFSLLECVVVLGIILTVAAVGIPILVEALRVVRGLMALVDAVTIH
jgi:prepilin-type N-terminal cleavage/methylation domain-containing protein